MIMGNHVSIVILVTPTGSAPVTFAMSVQRSANELGCRVIMVPVEGFEPPTS